MEDGGSLLKRPSSLFNVPQPTNQGTNNRWQKIKTLRINFSSSCVILGWFECLEAFLSRAVAPDTTFVCGFAALITDANWS